MGLCYFSSGSTLAESTLWRTKWASLLWLGAKQTDCSHTHSSCQCIQGTNFYQIYIDWSYIGNFFFVNWSIFIILTFLIRVLLQSSDSDSRKKFPSKSCPLRYGTAKIQEDTFNLFQAGLREFLGSFGVKTQGSQYSGWRITALSVSASKIAPVLSVSSNSLGL